MERDGANIPSIHFRLKRPLNTDRTVRGILLSTSWAEGSPSPAAAFRFAMCNAAKAMVE